MLNRLLASEEFAEVVEAMKAAATKQALRQALSDEDRRLAVERYHLIDELVREIKRRAKD